MDPGRRVVDGRFELLDRLGGGGMGLVWRARDLALHREVALKEVRPPDPALLEDDPTAARMLRERVLREARSLARLNHPHVVTIHHIVDAVDVPHPWLVMELVPGGSLHDRLALGPIPPREAARIGRGVLSALRAAHEAGIHHRDVKPGNVLLRHDGSPVLTDFGIAALRESTNLTATGELIGSPEYIAPERVRGEEDNPASDLWSLGMMLYVAVEGLHPLRRATSLATLAAVLTETLPPPVHAGALTPVLQALLVRDPAARPDAARLDRLLAEVEAGAGSGPGNMPGNAAEGMVGRMSEDAVEDDVRGLSHGTDVHSAPRFIAGHTTSAVPVTDLPPWSPDGPAARTDRSGPRDPSPFVVPHPPAHPRGPGRRTRRVRIVVGSVVGTCLITAVAALIAVSMLRESDPDTSGAGAYSSGGSAPTPSRSVVPVAPNPDETPREEPTTKAPAVNLLTPEGVRGLIRELKPVIGGTRVKSITIYDTYASIDAPVAGNARLYDRYSYRDGVTEKNKGFGSTDRDDKTIDLTKINWDALPALIKKANTELGVTTPTSRYINIDLGLIDRVASLSVYVSDEYGGGRVEADLDGKVLKTYPR